MVSLNDVYLDTNLLSSYIFTPDDLKLFYSLLSAKETDKFKFIFYLEVLNAKIKEKSLYTEFLTRIMVFLNENIENDSNLYRNSIFYMRILKTISNTDSLKSYHDSFVPISHLLILIIKNSYNKKAKVSSNKKYTFENIKINSDEVNNEELMIFIINSSLSLIKTHLFKYKGSIGFPELSATVVKELRSIDIKEFNVLVKDLISLLEKRKEYIEKERAKIKGELNHSKVTEFENKLKEN